MIDTIGKDALKIKYTKTYSKFKILPMNRAIDSKHVQKMIKSIRQMGVIRAVIATTTNIIEGKEMTYIIDGQHLAISLERENMDIPYIELKITSEEDLIAKMAMLNNSSKSWDLMDYINAWKMIRPDYMKLFKLKNMYDLEISMIACIALNKSSASRSGGSSTTNAIKKGEFLISNPKTEEMCKAFNDLILKIGNVDRSIKFVFLKAFIQAYPTYDHFKTLKNIDLYINEVKLISDFDQSEIFIQKKIFNIV